MASLTEPLVQLVSTGGRLVGGALSLGWRVARIPLDVAEGVAEAVFGGDEAPPEQASVRDPARDTGPVPDQAAAERPARAVAREKTRRKRPAERRAPFPPAQDPGEVAARERIQPHAEPVNTPSPAEMREAGREALDEDVELVAEFAEPGAEEGAGAELSVDPPWEGYGRMTAAQVQERLQGASVAVAGAVRLYESTHKRRSSVLRATERAMRAAQAPSTRA